ncbi:hypothetical protein [Stutzerimonas xanthomarina]|uniref:hypothetical protein n=1 Tax=Stutzerimonas xanthomarina TaxID=271420 RepID=UPI003AA844AE
MARYRGLKTTYYLRALAATSTEKSTINTGKLNAVSSGGSEAANSASAAPAAEPQPVRCRWHVPSITLTAKPASNRSRA